jgi:hypothetical protein
LDTAQWSTVFAAQDPPVSPKLERQKSASVLPLSPTIGSAEKSLLNTLLDARDDAERDAVVDRINKIKLANSSPISTPSAARHASLMSVREPLPQPTTEKGKVMRRASESAALRGNTNCMGLKQLDYFYAFY